MTMRIFGFYPSEKEAITVVNSLGLKGFRSKEITIFTTHSSATSLREYTDATIRSSVKVQHRKKTFFNQIRDLFINDSYTEGDFNYTLVTYGFDEETIEKCLNKIVVGNVLIVVDDYLRLGHSTVNEVLRPDLFNVDNQNAG